MGIWLMTAAANLVVGALVGLCGVAGFLLPMFYTAGLGMSVTAVSYTHLKLLDAFCLRAGAS